VTPGGAPSGRRFLPFAVTLALASVACAATVPRAEMDRCTLGIADGNDAYTVRQGAACASVAKHLAADDQARAALGYARKACDLEDARGCEEYLALVRGQPALPPDELMRARATGEKACAGMVLSVDGADVRADLCLRTAELYEDVQPASRSDAGRLFARACKLGDDRGCAKARNLGVEPGEPSLPPGLRAKPNSTASAQPLPPPGPRPVPTGPPPPATPACHEMRPCVSLDVQQRNVSEVVGSLANHCDRPVACTWCAAHKNQVDRSACHTGTLGTNEQRSGRDGGLWYDGYDSIAYDCMDATDPRGCLAL
jgi:hypothetical protein